MTQPEALRIADALDSGFHRSNTIYESAAELRRLHAERECDEQRVADLMADVDRLGKINEELLAALREIASETYDEWTNGAKAQRIARAAIKAAEERT